MLQTFTHYFLHLLFPLLLAFVFWKKDWKRTYLMLLLTMLVDLDHLMATPVFEADRCSIGFHILHSWWAMVFYLILLLLSNPYRILGVGLLLHMITDLIDCLFMYDKCPSCQENAPAYELLQFLSG